MKRILSGSAKLCFEELRVLTYSFCKAAEVTVDMNNISGKVLSHDVVFKLKNIYRNISRFV